MVVEVGVSFVKSRYQVSAPGSARLMDRGAICFGFELNGTIKISQHNPRVDFVQTGGLCAGQRLRRPDLH